MQAGFIPYVFMLLTLGSAGIIFLHGMDYAASIPYFIALVLAGAFITPYGNAFGSVCQAAGRPDLVTKLVLMNSVLNLFLSYTLIVLFGIWGAVIAPILTDFVGLIVIQMILRKVYSGNIIESYSNILSRLKILFHLTQKLGKSKVGGLFS
jgi:O-antigen/teichoic acid export membrane protein